MFTILILQIQLSCKLIFKKIVSGKKFILLIKFDFTDIKWSTAKFNTVTLVQVGIWLYNSFLYIVIFKKILETFGVIEQRTPFQFGAHTTGTAIKYLQTALDESKNKNPTFRMLCDDQTSQDAIFFLLI